jgi:hypothetical protein
MTNRTRGGAVAGVFAVLICTASRSGEPRTPEEAKARGDELIRRTNGYQAVVLR